MIVHIDCLAKRNLASSQSLFWYGPIDRPANIYDRRTQVSVHEFVASLRKHFQPLRPQLTEQEVTEIRSRLLDLVHYPAEPLQVEPASETPETLRIRRDE